MDNTTNTKNNNSSSSSIYIIVDFFSWLTKLCSLFNLIITFPIYFSLLYFLYKRRHLNPFNSSFYRLFFALGIVDITKYSLYLLKKCSYWGWVLPFFLPPDTPNKPAQLLYISVWALSFAQYQLNIALSLNRFISILLPQVFRHEYTKQFFRFIHWPIFLISVSIVIPILQMPVCFRTNIVLNNTENDENSSFVKLTGPVFVNQNDLNIYYGITKFFVLLLLLCCLIGYPLCFARVRQLNLKDKVLAVEVKMLFALILMLIANLLYIGYFIFWEIISRFYSQSSFFAEWSLYLIIDFYDMNSPYGILLTSSLVRRSVLPFKLFQNQNAIVPLIGNLRQHQDNRQVPLVENMQRISSSQNLEPPPSLVEPQASTLSSIS